MLFAKGLNSLVFLIQKTFLWNNIIFKNEKNYVLLNSSRSPDIYIIFIAIFTNGRNLVFYLLI
jgi:hypothetical protein